MVSEVTAHNMQTDLYYMYKSGINDKHKLCYCNSYEQVNQFVIIIFVCLCCIYLVTDDN